MNVHPSVRSLIVVATLMLNSVATAAPSLAPTDLRCEFRTNPLGLGETAPRLSWRLEAGDRSARGLRQSAWQVRVAATAEALAAGRADGWDTGKISSDASNNIVYAGRPLKSRDTCFWQVRVWDQAGEASAWSAPASWTIGLLGAAEWQADWIGLDATPPTDGSVISEAQRTRLAQTAWVRAALEPSTKNPLAANFRKSFALPADKKISRATLLLTADMRCAISINGRAMGEVTRWDRMAPRDVAAALVAGENVVGLAVAQDDGYPPAVLGELEVAFAGGESLRLPIDPTWMCAVDAPTGWDRVGFDASKWIAPERLADKKNPKKLQSPWGTPENSMHWLAPAPWLRKSFAIAKPVKRATVYATALGFYELQLNGVRVGHDVFAPGWTEYTKRLHYQTYDVTAQLKPGPNALGALLGDGWFAGLAGYTGKRHYYGGNPRLRAQLEIDYADGTRETIATDGSWRGNFGPVRYADLYLGTAYDARLERKDWARGDFDDKSWLPVTTGLSADAPKDFVLEAGTLDPVRVQDALAAKGVTQPRPGAYVFDLGQNMVGWVRLKVKGQAGQKLTLRHGEMLNPNGTLYTSNLRGATATDVFWLREGEQTLEPWGTLHGFRYVEITGLESAPTPAMVTGVVVHNPMARTGEFASSNADVNQLFHNIVWGQKGNYIEAPTDCPQRDERLGWTGDTQFFVRTGLYNFDAVNFLERWLTTIATDSQGADGTFPDTVPAVGHKPHAVTAWGDAALVVTHTVWKVYGDTRVVAKHYDELARYVAYLRGKAKGGIVKIGGYGDWLNKGGGAKTEVMDTAYYSYLCGLMAEMGRAIGRDADATKFADEQRAVTDAWRRSFLQPDGGILESSQTGFALAFTMGLLPEEIQARSAEKFVADIAGKNWHLATGFIGTPRLLPALHAAGRDDVAYKLLLQDTYPSWLFQVKLGATTMWERWDGWTPDQGFQSIGMNSFNHYAFGAVGEYLYRFVGGIDTDGAGFRKISIAPQPAAGLTAAQASYDAVTGKISSAWKIDEGKLTLDVTVPANTTATVRVPSGNPGSIVEGTTAAAKAKGVELVTTEAGAAIYRVGSGTYRFTAVAPKI